MAEPQIEVRAVPLEPGRPELGFLVGWYCEWNGQEYSGGAARAYRANIDVARVVALEQGKATMKEATDAQP